jgi:hypothetical protein
LSNKTGWFPRSSMAFSRRSGFGTCANKLKRPLDFDISLFHTAEKATARQDQPWKSCADDGGGDCQEYPPRCNAIFPVNKIPIFDCY